MPKEFSKGESQPGAMQVFLLGAFSLDLRCLLASLSITDNFYFGCLSGNSSHSLELCF